MSKYYKRNNSEVLISNKGAIYEYMKSITND